ncbi:MAG TPA: rhodanese-like domain-containing protein [Vicinamibacteria bacterium]|nr:rhodanese-like domain-containing protein [Vicinamibacteria bacterium]
MSRRISPQEARELMEEQGYVYVDVRSIPEFQAGHPEGAFNVPLLHLGPAGMTPNAEFLAVMQSAFPREAKLVVACKAGGRSARAAAMLEAAGFTNVVDQRAGFEGAHDPATGRIAEPGWRPAGLPVARDAAPGRDYESLKAGGK